MKFRYVLGDSRLDKYLGQYGRDVTVEYKGCYNMPGHLCRCPRKDTSEYFYTLSIDGGFGIYSTFYTISELNKKFTNKDDIEFEEAFINNEINFVFDYPLELILFYRNCKATVKNWYKKLKHRPKNYEKYITKKTSLLTTAQKWHIL